MDIETLREHCLSIEGATESTPFMDPNVLVFKIRDKMFAMLSLMPKNDVFWVDLKCDPTYSLALRETYNGIQHAHVKTTLLWNRVILESDVPDKLIVRLIHHSVEEVKKKLPKK